MPNHVTNIITADQEVIDHLTKVYSEEEKEAHRVKHAAAKARREEIRVRIALPEDSTKIDMEKFQALTDEEREAYYYFSDPELPDFVVDFNKVVPEPANIETGGCTGSHPEGVICWYSWHIENWGTKWGGYSAAMVEGGVKFETAWSHPFPIIQALSKAHPDKVIEVKYADEDTSSNLGWYWVKNGLCVQYARIVQWTTQAYSHAIWVNGSYGGSLETMLDEWYGEESYSYYDEPDKKAEAIERGKKERVDFLAGLKEMDRKAGVGDGEPTLVMVQDALMVPEQAIAQLEELARKARNGEGIYEAEHAVKDLSSPDADGNGTVECVCGEVIKWGPSYGTAHKLFGVHSGRLQS